MDVATLEARAREASAAPPTKHRRLRRRGPSGPPGKGGLARTEILTLRPSLESLGAAELRATIERRTFLSPFDPRPFVFLVL
jgi:hypothetical protein